MTQTYLQEDLGIRAHLKRFKGGLLPVWQRRMEADGIGSVLQYTERKCANGVVCSDAAAVRVVDRDTGI